MSVFVKDMEMPKCCEDCPMYDDEISWCNQKQVHICDVRDIGEQRPICCPLKEITTPHGKLIDAAEMSRVYTHYGNGGHMYDATDLDDMLEEMDAVIEAE